MSSTKSTCFHASSFQVIKDAMLQSPDLPLAEVIDDPAWQAAFARYGVDFGTDENAIYTPAVTLWALISQVFYKDEQRSCKAAVMRVAALWAMLGKIVCRTNTGAYCRARLKVAYQAIRDIARQVALDAEAAFEQPSETRGEAEKYPPDRVTKVHPVVARIQQQPAAGRIFLFDAFTATASDTPENQDEFPQNPAQKEGLGFPIIRCATLISMVTGMLLDVAIGPYSGKQSGETWLLWQMLNQLQPGDTLVADCYLCTYWIVAACQLRGVKIVMKNHDKRDDHPARARCLNPHERVTTWLRPPRPDWMSEEEHAACPEQIDVRLVDLEIEQRGFRPKRFTIATTILETEVYSREWITMVYRSRWLVELDIRSIKCSLGMDVIRAKTPAMVRTEIWSCLLAYNLIRMKMLQSGAVSGDMPRSLSFTTTMQLLSANWVLASVMLTDELVTLGIQASGSETVGDRPDRIEPRANKRRPKLIALLTKPRRESRQELLAA